MQQALDLATPLRERFWERYSLSELHKNEWEALCDGCGLCCLHKLEDADTGQVVYTKVACVLLNTSNGQCSNYPARKTLVSECLQLTPVLAHTAHWLPNSCAYKRLAKGQKLPRWHPLLTGNSKTVLQQGQSVAGRCISENDVAGQDWEEYVIKWVKF